MTRAVNRPFYRKAVRFLNWRKREHGIPWRHADIRDSDFSTKPGDRPLRTSNHVRSGIAEVDVAFEVSLRTGRFLT